MSTLVLVANSGDSTISSYRIDASEGSVRLRPLAISPSAEGCSTFAIDAERNLVHAAGAGAGEGIHTLSLNRSTGELTQLRVVSAGGPQAYLTLTPDGRHLLGANYHQGVGLSWPVNDGRVTDPVARVGFPNLHSVLTSADGRFAYFASLGADLIAQYHLGDDGSLSPLPHQTVHAPAGSGPRHLVLNADQTAVYLVTEFSGEAIRFARDTTTGELTMAEAVPAFDVTRGLQHSVFGADPRAEHLIWGADLHLALDQRLLLVSERCESTIAAVRVDESGRLGQVAAITDVPKQPRGFAITPDGRHAVVVGELETRACLYRIEGDGRLSLVDEQPCGTKPNWVRMLDLS